VAALAYGTATVPRVDKIILSLTDVETQEYFARVIGEGEVLRRSVSESKGKSSGGGTGGFGGGSNQSLSRQHSEVRERVVTEADLATKKGFGYCRLLDDEEDSQRYAISLNYIKDSELPPLDKVVDFIKNESKMFRPRRLPYFRISPSKGQLVDPFLGKTVGVGHHLAICARLNEVPEYLRPKEEQVPVISKEAPEVAPGSTTAEAPTPEPGSSEPGPQESALPPEASASPILEPAPTEEPTETSPAPESTAQEEDLPTPPSSTKLEPELAPAPTDPEEEVVIEDPTLPIENPIEELVPAPSHVGVDTPEVETPVGEEAIEQVAQEPPPRVETLDPVKDPTASEPNDVLRQEESTSPPKKEFKSPKKS
jgi:hypothetical protein